MSFCLHVKCIYYEPTVYVDFFLIDLFSLVKVVWRPASFFQTLI